MAALRDIGERRRATKVHFDELRNQASRGVLWEQGISGDPIRRLLTVPAASKVPQDKIRDGRYTGQNARNGN